ncbi:MAG: hydralysin-2 [Polyangiaceae bacterium]|nr:hydralysin-2 [Polyangiaceae bacterium]
MAVKEALSFSDLVALSSSPDSVREAFKKHYNKTPDGISVNSETYFDAVKPAITERYGHPCYKTLGDVTYVEGPSEDGVSAIVGTQYAVNNSDQPAQITLAVNGSWSETTTVESSVTVGMKFSSEIGLEGVFKSGMEFSTSITAGQSSSKSVARGSEASVTVTLPPKSRQRVDIVATMRKQSMAFSAPIRVQGMFGANFPDRVNGHYFWFLSAHEVLHKTEGVLKGKISNTAAFETHTTVGPIEKLNG